jgi:ubiquinol-cytochrome c reductase cytochrome b subunit
MTTTQSNGAQDADFGKVGKALDELDDRLGISKGGRSLMDKIFPDHWSFMLGEIALYSFMILMITGVFLTFFYVPSSTVVTYHGPYMPLYGQKMSQAYASSIDLSFSVRSGLLMRQMHHWACDIFLAAMVVHMARVFFTGAFRKPRETNYVIGSLLLILGIFNGFLGYSLPDDLVSGTGIRIAFSIVESIPLVGTYIAFFLFGGNYPGPAIIPRFFILHVLLLPLIMLGLVTAHLFLLVHQKHTQFPGKGRTEDNVVGTPMVPVFAAKATGFMLMVAGVTALLGGLAQINPIWQFGPYVASKISYAVQPDWYMGWLDGALRIFPAWEWTGFGFTFPLEVFIPAIVIPGIIFGVVQLWPMIERRRTGDDEIHNLLDLPRNRPKRTAFGAGLFALVSILFVASSTDVVANFFHVSLEGTLWAMRILTFAVPVVVYFLTAKICQELQQAPGAGKRKRANVVLRTPAGEYRTEAAPARPGDEHVELEAEPVPDLIDLGDEGTMVAKRGELPPVGDMGVRQVPR